MVLDMVMGRSGEFVVEGSEDKAHYCEWYRNMKKLRDGNYVKEQAQERKTLRLIKSR